MYRAKGLTDQRVVVDLGEPAEPAADPAVPTNGHRPPRNERLWAAWGGLR
jgi:hypothetical protein